MSSFGSVAGRCLFLDACVRECPRPLMAKIHMTAEFFFKKSSSFRPQLGGGGVEECGSAVGALCRSVSSVESLQPGKVPAHEWDLTEVCDVFVPVWC